MVGLVCIEFWRKEGLIASIDRVQGISFLVPERSVQDKTIEKIMEIEKQIREAEKELAALNGKTAEIVRSYL